MKKSDKMDEYKKRRKLIAIYGASGFGREVAWLIESIADTGNDYRISCFIDDDQSKHRSKLNGIPVMGLEAAVELYAGSAIVGGIGNPNVREKLMAKADRAGFRFESLIHATVERSRWIKYAEGVVICAGNILTTNIILGRHVQINLDCTIGHDVVMNDFTTLAPGVHVSGWVHFGKRVYVGTGAVFINGTKKNPLEIGDDAVIGAGACVTNSVPAGETWVGVPARKLK